MFGVMRDITNLVIGIAFYGWLGTYGLKEIYYFVKKEAITKVSKGLPSMQRLTEQMTCVRYDEKWRAIPIMTGHCGKYYRKQRAKQKR